MLLDVVMRETVVDIGKGKKGKIEKVIYELLLQGEGKTFIKHITKKDVQDIASLKQGVKKIPYESTECSEN